MYKWIIVICICEMVGDFVQGFSMSKYKNKRYSSRDALLYKKP